MYNIRLRLSDKKFVLKKTANNIVLRQTGRRGPKGDPGDPGSNLVTSVNGEQGVVVLDSTDVGADPAGSAAQALTDANTYTDNVITAIDTGVMSVVAGTNVTVDDTDPANPIVNASGGGAVDSVNGQTGVVVLELNDLDDVQGNPTPEDILSFAGDSMQWEPLSITGVLSSASTDDLQEGSNNLYFTDQRAIDALQTDLGTVADGAANSYYVETPANGGDDSNSGRSWGNAFATIEHALDTLQSVSLNTPGTIYVGQGTFTLNSAVVMTRLQSLIGKGANRTIIENAVNAPGILYTGVSPEAVPYSSTNYPNTGLMGFTIRPSGSPGTDTAGIKVQDVVFAQIQNVFANGFTGVRGVGIWVFNKELPDGSNPGGFVERLQLKQVATDNNTYGILLDRLIAGQPSGINDYRTDQVGYGGYGNTATNADNSVMYHTWVGVSINARAVAAGANAQIGLMIQKGVQFYHSSVGLQFNITGVNGANTVAPISIRIQNSSAFNSGQTAIRGEASGTGATSIDIDDTSTFDAVGLLDFLYSANFPAQIIGAGHNGVFKFAGGANGYGLTHTTQATKPIHTIIEKVTLAGAINTAPPNGPAERITNGMLDPTHPAFDWLRITNQRYGLNSFDGTTTLTYMQVLQDVTIPIIHFPQGLRIMSGSNVFSGSGAPDIASSPAGSVYFRTDTPSTMNQKIYLATATNTWSSVTDGFAPLDSPSFTGTVGTESLTSSGVITPSGGVAPSVVGFTTFGTGPGLNALNTTSGTSTVAVAGTIYWAAIFIPTNITVTGLTYTTGATNGAGNVILGLYNSAGVLLRSTALAGTAVSGSSVKQSIDLTAPVVVVGPGLYFIAIQLSTTTAKFQTFSNAGEKFVVGSTTGTFGTLPSITPGSTYATGVGPYASTY
jgi:hypothetical protein